MCYPRADIAIIGAGAVGCAIARHIALCYPEKQIVALEKLTDPCRETSRFNSGVLHSGIHQNPKFLKSRLAQRGSRLATQFAKEKNLNMISNGMLVAIPKSGLFSLAGEIGGLVSLLKNGRAQNISFTFLTAAGVRRMEPNISALGGIFIPDVRVVDPEEFVGALFEDALRYGVQFYFKTPVIGIRNERFFWRIFTPRGVVGARAVINAAGLYADEIAKMADAGTYKIYPMRGEYYEVVGEKKNLVSRLVYPAVPKKYPGKGVHFGPRPDGRLFIGPNARPVPAKDYYEQDKTPPEVFLKTAKKFLPQLEEKDLVWAYSGIRPKTTPDAEESDFVISLDIKEPQLLNLIGIESPGLASCMAIAEYVANLLNFS